MIPKILLLAALGVSLCGWVAYQQHESESRKTAAADWSGDGVEFIATGLTNETLVLGVPGSDPVLCDVYVDNILSGKDTLWLIKSQGFTKLRCGDRITNLK